MNAYAGSPSTTVQGSGPGAGQDDIILSVRDVSRYFGALKALDHVSFDVRRKQIFSVIGPNGAGKTTLFNVITGAYPPTTGQAFFQGQQILGMADYKITRLGMARTFQTLRLFKNLTVLDNVIVAMYCRTKSNVVDALLLTPQARRETKASLEKAHELLRMVGIDQYWWSLSRNLPYGHQRRLEIARALATDPQMVLLDEPTCGMNPAEKEGMMALIQQLRDNGLTVILVEHDMKVVMGMSDWVVVLDHGEEICDGVCTEVQANPMVIEAYLGKGAVQ